MDIRNVWAVYFSPTGGTEKIVTRTAANLAALLDADYRVADLTKPKYRKKPLSFGKEALVVMGMPVYAGRVPYFLRDYLRAGRGGGALGVAVVIYGNRAYDGALAELADIMASCGMKITAAAAFIAEHSFSDTLAKGRPDAADMEKAEAFYKAVYDKLSRDGADAPVEIPRGPGYDEYYKAATPDGGRSSLAGVKPVTDAERCVWCRECARACPMEAISYMRPADVEGTCVLCGACVKVCRKQAKSFDDPEYIFHKEYLERECAERKEPEYYL